jgi:hypothetical protein
MKHKNLFAFSLLAGALLTLSVVASAQVTYKQLATIKIPGDLTSFDIAWVDSATQRLYLADRGGGKGLGRIDVIDTSSNTFLYSIPTTKGELGFVGVVGSGRSGPDGVVLVPQLNQLYVGDGDSTVKVVDLAAKAIIAIIPVCSSASQQTALPSGFLVRCGDTKFRADELNYDSNDRIVMVANPNDNPPFVTFISVDTQAVVGQYVYPGGQAQANNPNGGGGLEQPVWDPANDKFYITVPATDSAPGSVDQFDPKTFKREKSYSVPLCNAGPAGLVITANQRLMTSCGILLDARSGNTFPTPLGLASDQIWYNSGDNRYYFGSSGSVVDAETNQLIANLPGPTGRIIAVDSNNNHAFTPVGGVGIVVYGVQ